MPRRGKRSRPGVRPAENDWNFLICLWQINRGTPNGFPQPPSFCGAFWNTFSGCSQLYLQEVYYGTTESRDHRPGGRDPHWPYRGRELAGCEGRCVRHRSHHPIRSHRSEGPSGRGGQGLRAGELHEQARGQADGPLHPDGRRLRQGGTGRCWLHVG